MPKQESHAPENRRGSILDNHLALVGISVLCGFLAWMIVTMYFVPQNSNFVYVDTINFQNSATTYTSQGLDIVQTEDVGAVRVKIEGNGTVIGGIGKEDIMVYPSYANVKGPGEVTLRLNARIANTSEYGSDVKVTVENPTTVRVVFDEVSEKTLPVTADTSTIAIADGNILNKSTSAPAEVTLRGPTSELEKISSVVAVLNTENTISDTTTLPATLELRDENGEVPELTYTTMDAESANVTLTIYQVRELPLTVDFIGVPSGFDTASLQYSLSQQTLKVAGPARIVSGMQELSVTSFDLSREFAFDRDYQRQIELPAGLVAQDGSGTVTLSFDTTNMSSVTLNVFNLRAVNVPSNYDIQILSSMVNGITLYGPREEIQALSAASVQAEVDCASVSLTAGQMTLPVTVRVPSSGRIFAVGSYTVQCEITAK